MPGPAGALEVLIDRTVAPPVGVAIVTHPQPLLGGSPRHKIPHKLAHGLRDAGWLVLRPSFRGVENSAGVYDHGVGETLDILTVVEAVRHESVRAPLALIGFSFGAYVLARVIRLLLDSGAAPLPPLLDWARPTSHPIIVVPGADHFFNRSQDLLLSLVLAHLPKESAKARTD